MTIEEFNSVVLEMEGRAYVEDVEMLAGCSLSPVVVAR